jgi:hypothetical protein
MEGVEVMPKKGWQREPARHSLAAKGVKTQTPKMRQFRMLTDKQIAKNTRQFEWDDLLNSLQEHVQEMDNSTSAFLGQEDERKEWINEMEDLIDQLQKTPAFSKNGYSKLNRLEELVDDADEMGAIYLGAGDDYKRAKKFAHKAIDLLLRGG